ncbi:hypothetical protein ACLB2K_076977 [Fragaria x ananassa]
MIRDMGRDIVRQENAKNPDKRSRLWHHKDSLIVLRANKGSETIEGLSLQMHMYTADNEDIYSLKSLETFIFSGCSNLYEFPMEMRNMASLKVLETDEIPINRLLATTEDQVKSWPMLKHIDNFWASFPNSLLELSLTNCNLSDDAFPMELSNLSSLKRLYFTGNPICRLPDCIRGLEELDYLGFSGCTSLKGLEGLPRVSRELLTVSCISLERINFQSI